MRVAHWGSFNRRCDSWKEGWGDILVHLGDTVHIRWLIGGVVAYRVAMW